jgi:putative DNA primase/helicase
VAFLESLQSDGPVAVPQIRKDATGAGYAWRTIERAKKKAGIEARKLGMNAGWVWSLKGEVRQIIPKIATQKSGSLRVNVADFGKTEPYPTEPKSPTDDDVEVF